MSNKNTYNEPSRTIDISEYDLHGYDYEDYWKQGRGYEDDSDKLAIQHFIKNEMGDWYIDIGGSYGRLLPTYRSKFLHCVLSDYSIEALKKAKRKLKDGRITNVDLVALNVYNLPFKDNSFNAGQTIRVMHHIEQPEEGLKEISRIIKKNGFFILEFANKIHFLAKIKAILKLKPGFIFSKEPYKQPTKETKQGTKDVGLFFNFHPNHIKNIVENNGFKIEKKLSVSNLRSQIIKKFLSAKILIKIESFLQKLLSFTTFGPSQYRKLRKVEGERTAASKSVYEIICCPKCKGELTKKGSDLICSECRESFPITFGILDLRWPRPSK